MPVVLRKPATSSFLLPAEESTRFEKMALQDPAFNIIPKDSTCFIIWRVENMGLVPLPKEAYGKFHKGDAYLVMSASAYGTPGGVDTKPHKPRGSRLVTHIHFWLGSESSQDEQGVAAIKSVELDDSLGGAPIQHREVEGKESQQFKAYFKNGMRVLQGGIGTGFRHVKDDFQTKLYSVKGKRSTVIKELPKVSWKSMNDGDVYVLDTREIIFVWTGRYANNVEKLQGAKFASNLRMEHGGGSVVILEDGQELALGQHEAERFTKYLPLNDKQVTPALEAERDDVQERRVTEDIKLFRCSDEEGTLKVTEVKNGPLLQKDLKSDDSYIVDNGSDGIWVWIGKRASAKERSEGMRNALGFIKKKKYPVNTLVSRVIDGGEPAEFKSLFKNWRDRFDTVGFGKKQLSSKIAATVQTTFDAKTLHSTPALAAQTQMVDDGTGQKEVWRVKNFELESVNEKEYGEFYMGDCYLVLYAYNTGGTDHYLVYYWIGSKATKDEAGTAALKAVELDDKLGGRPVQVRVTQGSEPPHFMTVFGGRMVVYEGGYASAFDGNSGKDVSVKNRNRYMLQVRGNDVHSTKAIEVDCRGGSLNSNDCFLLVAESKTYIWCGKGSTGDEREMAKKLAKGKGEIILVSEGQEKEEFWSAIGGKEAYASSERLQRQATRHEPRLFQCSNASGAFNVEEIINFGQDDLVEDDVMILDAWDTVFVWVGTNSNKVEKKAAERAAFEYLRTDPAGRTYETPMVRINQGYEPPNFTGYFGAWDNDLWNNNMTYADICERLEEVSPGATILVSSTGSPNGSGGGPNRTYPLAVLREKDPESLPEDVDPTCKEDFLHENDFEKAFKMSREQYEALPSWKRVNKKKEAGLF